MKTRYERQTIVDSETGEILIKYDKTEYTTVKIETKTREHENTRWIKTTRIVKHNGQGRLLLD